MGKKDEEGRSRKEGEDLAILQAVTKNISLYPCFILLIRVSTELALGDKFSPVLPDYFFHPPFHNWQVTDLETGYPG